MPQSSVVFARRVTRGASAIAFMIGGATLFGWAAGIAVLQRFGGIKPMNPVAAVALVLLSVSLWLLTDGAPQRRRILAGQGCAIAGALLAAGRLVGLDRLLFTGAMQQAPGGVELSRMAPQTAFCLLLTAVGLLFKDDQFRGWRPAEALGLASIVLAFHALGGHLVGAASLSEAIVNPPMSLNGAFAFVALGIGVAAARPDLGLMGRLRLSSSVRRQVNLGFGIGAAVLILLGSAGTWSSIRSEEAARERRALYERRTLIEHLLGALQDAETGQRGFLLTGDTSFLEPYQAVATSFPVRLAAIRGELAPFPDRVSRLTQLDSLVGAKTAEMERTIALRRAGRAVEALAIVRAGAGKRGMDDIRTIVTSLVREDQALLQTADQRLRVADRLTFLTSSVGAVLTAIFLLVGIGAVNRNIAGRERAEAALRESERRLFQLIDALPIAVYVIDAKGSPFYSNRASQAILGQTVDPTLSASDLPAALAVYVMGTDQLYPAERQPIVRALGGESVYAEDLELHRADRRIPLEVWASPVYDSFGKISYAVAVFSDISERQHARAMIRDLNQQLNRRVAELTELNHELEAFTYSVSHDLRAPVRHIDGFSRLLQEVLGADADPKWLHYLARIRGGATQMGQLIDDLLQLSRVSRQELLVQRTDLNALLRSVVYDLRDETQDRDIEWRIEKLHSVEGDPGLLKQVFVNLLTNALKFTRPRSRAVIEVAETSANGDRALFVRDNGVGFDMRYAEKLFGVFQRLHLAEEFPGTGVGLAIVQRIVRKHGGRAWAEAELDKGATFYFSLPAALKHEGR